MYLPLRPENSSDASASQKPSGVHSPIESDAFPFEAFCDAAEMESWRKEIHRPLYHIHKWWATRLGTVFRAIVIGTLAERNTDVARAFYRRVRFPSAVVFDPFMGSGTTLGEAVKLGCRVIGRDINPVAHFAVHNALTQHDRSEVLREFKSIERDVADRIQHYYRARLPDGRSAQVLYYFWVKTLNCPGCPTKLDLFQSRVFARHARPHSHPIAQALCPECGQITATRYDALSTKCSSCEINFKVQSGPAQGAWATCPGCSLRFKIIAALRNTAEPPEHRLFAKLVLLPDGQKRYLAADDYDRSLYGDAVTALAAHGSEFPGGTLVPGYNTRQAMNYGYAKWRQMFNDRQLLCLGILADRIRSIPNPRVRNLFVCLFSGALEFNNMFASYKGEGTGAVRHMFSHHILRPVRTPLEANPWGTPRSSGSFSTLFARRIVRAMDYCDAPFEIKVAAKGGHRRTQKVFGLSESIGYSIARTYEEFEKGERVYLSCGDSGSTDVPSGSVDAVITDPPFFDNVHYSELADFFYVWQQYIRYPEVRDRWTTRSGREVQHVESATFERRLGAVLAECHRVLTATGLLVFTYHHSRPEGWGSVLRAVTGAEFVVVAAHPIKAEMSVATPKRQSKEPIDLDTILVCRKREPALIRMRSPEMAWSEGLRVAGCQVQRLRRAGRMLSRSDVMVVLSAQLVRFLSSVEDPATARVFLENSVDRVDAAVTSLSFEDRGNVKNEATATSGALGAVRGGKWIKMVDRRDRLDG